MYCLYELIKCFHSFYGQQLCFGGMLHVDFAGKPFSYLIEVNRRLVPFFIIPELFCSCHFCQVRDPATYHPEREHVCRNDRRESAA